MNPGVGQIAFRLLQGGGGAAQLGIIRAAAAFLFAGAANFRLYTAARNHLACRLYRSLGFAEAKRFQLFGEERICFVRSTRFEDPL